MGILELILVVYLGFLAWSRVKGNKKKKLPPGPFPLPIVGNLHQLSSTLIHQSFAKLSQKYGPVMTVRLGSVLSVVVSSPELAKDVLVGHGFSDRPCPENVHTHDHNEFSIGVLPASSQKWRDFRKIYHEQLFANQSMEKSQPLRQQKLGQLIDYVQKCCDAGREVNIHEAFSITTVNLMSATLYSIDEAEFDSRETRELMKMLIGIVRANSHFSLANFFPFLKYFKTQEEGREADLVIGRFLEVIKKKMDQRIELRKTNRAKYGDFLDTLLDIAYGTEYDLDLNDVNHLLLDTYVGGSDSISLTIEWVLTELLNNPHAMAKLKHEVREFMGDRRMIEEADISRLPYLQAVFKETLRVHPTGPLLFPRLNSSDMELNGYFIPKGTQVYVNMWAIGRDPAIWPDPESFRPERFLENNIDYRGHNFKYVPFGSGRRICPGLPMADRFTHATLAALIRNFDWEFAPGERERNGELCIGPTMRRKYPLIAIPLKPKNE